MHVLFALCASRGFPVSMGCLLVLRQAEARGLVDLAAFLKLFKGIWQWILSYKLFVITSYILKISPKKQPTSNAPRSVGPQDSEVLLGYAEG